MFKKLNYFQNFAALNFAITFLIRKQKQSDLDTICPSENMGQIPPRIYSFGYFQNRNYYYWQFSWLLLCPPAHCACFLRLKIDLSFC